MPGASCYLKTRSQNSGKNKTNFWPKHQNQNKDPWGRKKFRPNRNSDHNTFFGQNVLFRPNQPPLAKMFCFWEKFGPKHGCFSQNRLFQLIKAFPPNHRKWRKLKQRNENIFRPQFSVKIQVKSKLHHILILLKKNLPVSQVLLAMSYTSTETM